MVSTRANLTSHKRTIRAAVFLVATLALVAQSLTLPAPSFADGEQPRNIEVAQVEEGTVWYLAEGCTGGDYETYILVQNPGSEPAQVTLTFMTGEGPMEGPAETLPPRTRKTWAVNDYVTSWDVSTKVTSDVPVIAERAVYWGGRVDGHDCAGVTIPSERWYLAEGCTGGDFETYILVQNPGGEEAKVKITYQGAAGPIPGPELTLQARSRQTVNAASTCPGLWDVSTLVEADKPVICERAMYWHGKDGGHDSAGVTTAERIWYLAEGCTGGDFETYILVQNPGGEEAHVKITYQGAAGPIPGPEITVPAGSRQTVNAAATCPGLWDVSTLVEADVPVIAERAVYWAGKGGGHDAVGYAPKRPEIPETTKVLSVDSTSKIASVSGDQKAITFSSSNPQVEGLSVGDIITCGVSPKTPYGLLRKITAINSSGGSTTLITERASLGDAIMRGSLSADRVLRPDMIASYTALMDGVVANTTYDATEEPTGFFIELKDVVLFEQGPSKVKANGSISFDPRFNLDVSIDYDPLRIWEGPKNELIAFTATFNEKAELEVSAEIELIEEEIKIEIIRYYLAPITFMIGPVPVVITPVISIHVGLDGSVSVGISTSVTQEAQLTVGLSYNNGVKNRISSFSNTFSYTPPRFSLDAEVKAYAGPQLDLMLYGVAGAYAEVNGFLEFIAELIPDQSWELYGGLEANVGLKLLDYEYDLPMVIGYRKLLASDSGGATFVKWRKALGGADDDYAWRVQQVSGGYILAGATRSYSVGEEDAWLIKVDTDGQLIWQKNFGGADNDNANSVQQTTDGGYIIAGSTRSSGAGEEDAWLIKTDSAGSLVWQKNFGGTDSDIANSVQQTTDGGYIIAGSTKSSGAGEEDAWLIKTDSAGSLVWQKTYGGTAYDAASSVLQTSDGGYILAGGTNSDAYYREFYVVKTNSSGNIIWKKNYGGPGIESEAFSIRQTKDGGYIVAGRTGFYEVAGADAWLVKINSTGKLVWDERYGGLDNDAAISVQQTDDNGFIFAGWNFHSYEDGYEAWLVKTDPKGVMKWERFFGGGETDAAYSIEQTPDHGYILAGETRSFGFGGQDLYLIKTDYMGR